MLCSILHPSLSEHRGKGGGKSAQYVRRERGASEVRVGSDGGPAGQQARGGGRVHRRSRLSGHGSLGGPSGGPGQEGARRAREQVALAAAAARRPRRGGQAQPAGAAVRGQGVDEALAHDDGGREGARQHRVGVRVVGVRVRGGRGDGGAPQAGKLRAVGGQHEEARAGGAQQQRRLRAGHGAQGVAVEHQRQAGVERRRHDRARRAHVRRRAAEARADDQRRQPRQPRAHVPLRRGLLLGRRGRRSGGGHGGQARVHDQVGRVRLDGRGRVGGAEHVREVGARPQRGHRGKVRRARVLHAAAQHADTPAVALGRGPRRRRPEKRRHPRHLPIGETCASIPTHIHTESPSLGRGGVAHEARRHKKLRHGHGAVRPQAEVEHQRHKSEPEQLAHHGRNHRRDRVHAAPHRPRLHRGHGARRPQQHAGTPRRRRCRRPPHR